MAANNFTYHREGGELGKVLHHEGLTRRQALQLVGEHIFYNGLASKADAQRFTAKMVIGEAAEFGPYTFTVGKE